MQSKDTSEKRAQQGTLTGRMLAYVQVLIAEDMDLMEPDDFDRLVSLESYLIRRHNREDGQ